MEITFQQAVQLAWQLCSEESFEQATGLLDQLLRAAPDHPDSLYMRGAIHIRRGEFAPGIDRLRHAVRVAPDRSDFRIGLCRGLFFAGNIPGTIEEAVNTILMKIGDDRPEAMRLLLATADKSLIDAPPFAACRRLVTALAPRPGERMLEILNGSPQGAAQSHTLATYASMAYILCCGGADEDAISLLGQAASLATDPLPQESETDYAALSGDYDSNTLHRGCNETMAAILEEHLPPRTASILDACCGTGILGTFLRQRTDVLAGFDLSGEMLARAQQRQLYDTLVIADANDDGAIPAGPFDAIVSSAALHHIADLTPFIHSAARRLAAGGLLVFSTEAATDESYRSRSAIGGFGHSRAYLSDTAKAAGLETVSIQLRLHRRYPGFYAVFRKAQG